MDQPAEDHRRVAVVTPLTPRGPPAGEPEPEQTGPAFALEGVPSEEKLVARLRELVCSVDERLSVLEGKKDELAEVQKRSEQAEKERESLSSKLEDQHGHVTSLKQRILILHEQNRQLAKLATEVKGGSAEILRMRNTLAASLAQLKQLDEQVQGIPELKQQLRSLKGQRQPAVELADCQARNRELEQANSRLEAFVEQQLTEIRTSRDSLSKKLDHYHEAHSRETDAVSKQLADLVSTGRAGGVSAGEAELLAASLQLKVDWHRQREQLARHLLQMEVQEGRVAGHRVESQAAGLGLAWKPHPPAEPVGGAEAYCMPEIEMLKTTLQQLELSREQARCLVESLLSERGGGREGGGGEEAVGVACVWEALQQQLLLLQRQKSELEEAKAFLVRQAEGRERELEAARTGRQQAEQRAKEDRERLGGVAKELTSSVGLLKKYQDQCFLLTQELDTSKAEVEEWRGRLGQEGSGRQDAELQEALATLREDTSRLTASLMQREAEMKAVEESLKLMEQHNTALKEDLQQARTQVASVSSEKDGMAEKHKLLLKELSDLREEKQGLVGALDTAEWKRTDLQMQCDRCNATISELRKELSLAQHNFDVVQLDLDRAESEADRFGEENKSLSEQVAGLVLAVAEKERCLKLEAEKSGAMQRQVEALKAKDDSRHRDVDSLKSSQLQLETENRVLRESVAGLERRVCGKESELTVLNEKLQCASSEAHHLECQLKDAKSLVESKQHSLAGERDELAAKCSMLAAATQELEGAVQQREEDVQSLRAEVSRQKHVITKLEQQDQSKSDLLEGYTATVDSLKRKLDEGETREVELEELKLQMAKLKHDNQSLLALLRDTAVELPNFAADTNQSLREENIRLEQQVSVLSQWNDKKMEEIERLEHTMATMEAQQRQLLHKASQNQSFEAENFQLRQELQEVEEQEVSRLRQQARADVQEELEVRLKTQSQLLAVFNQHNLSLQQQVKQLLTKVKMLGGALPTEKPVSPPPMMQEEVYLGCSGPGAAEDIVTTNALLKERMSVLERRVARQQVKARRQYAVLSAMASLQCAPGDPGAEGQRGLSVEMLRACSLLADALAQHKPLVVSGVCL